MRTLIEYNQQKCYLIISDEAMTIKSIHDWKSKRSLINWKNKMIKAVAVAAYAVINLNEYISTNNSSVFTSMIINLNLKYICINEVIIYDQSIAVAILYFIIDEYQNMFIDQKITINISENQWMFINLKSNVMIKPFKIYSLDQKDRKIVNITFNKLHAQDKMHYII